MQRIHSFVARHPDALLVTMGLLLSVGIPGFVYSNPLWTIGGTRFSQTLIHLMSLASFLCGITAITVAAFGMSGRCITIDDRLRSLIRVGSVVVYLTCGVALIVAIVAAMFDSPGRTSHPPALINLSLIRLLFAGVGAVALGWTATLQRPFNERFFVACLAAGAFIGYVTAFVILYIIVGGALLLGAYRWGLPLLAHQTFVVPPLSPQVNPPPVQQNAPSAEEQELLRRIELARTAPVPEHIKREEVASLQQQLARFRGTP